MSSPAPLAAPINKALNWSIFLSILLSLAGLVAILVPPISGIAITLVLGWIMVFSAFTHFFLSFKIHTTGSVLWQLLLGVVYFIAGIYLVLRPLTGLASLTLLLAVYLFLAGGIEIILAIQTRPRHGTVWLWINAIVTLILAVMIWRTWPFSSTWAIGTLVGIAMLFTGISRLMIALAAKRALTPLD